AAAVPAAAVPAAAIPAAAISTGWKPNSTGSGGHHVRACPVLVSLPERRPVFGAPLQRLSRKVRMAMSIECRLPSRVSVYGPCLHTRRTDDCPDAVGAAIAP